MTKMTDPLIIDSFAGGGGASTGIEAALGRSPDVAINHSAAALALHAANHPETLHLDSNIWDVDPRTVTGGRPVGLLWASPDCKHFSKAKGGAPKDRNIRDLAWVVVRWMEQVRPAVVLMENVEEFRTWGPIDNDGQPIKEFEGQTFDDWCHRIRRAGYRLQWRELRACDYGAPTIRKRFFMVARRDGRPITWPKPTHGDPTSPDVRRDRLLPWRTAAECIDFALPCPSIFDSSDQIMAAHGLRAIRPLKPNTLARIARGVKRYVLDAGRPFLVNVANGQTTGRGPNAWPLADPLRTATAAPGFALVAPSITRFNGGATGWNLSDPAPTVTANSWINRPGGAAPLGLVAPTLATYYGHGGGRGVRAADLTDPLRTATVENRHALIAPHLMTMRNAAKPFNGADEPAHTVTAGGAGLTLVAPVMTYAQQGGAVRDVQGPAHTITASSKDQNSLITAWLAKWYGAPQDPRLDEPMHTCTTKPRFDLEFATCQKAPTFGPEHHARARQVADFLRAHGAWDGGEFVTLAIDGTDFVMTDIGMRMLTPRELFNAQGFPPDYVIEGTWTQDGDEWSWHPIPKNVQVSCCGNSVCPPLAEALVRANCTHLMQQMMEVA
jgi:DNA (cytosine-5)-methyltransferase 1